MLADEEGSAGGGRMRGLMDRPRPQAAGVLKGLGGSQDGGSSGSAAQKGSTNLKSLFSSTAGPSAASGAPPSRMRQ